jgi:clan AA aspartic protease (TIGR02281 family)
MRLLFWLVAMSCLSCAAGAQQPNSDQRLPPNSRLAPQLSQNLPPSGHSSSHAFYYRPGDPNGVPFDTIEECTNAIQLAGNVGVCIVKAAAVVISMHSVAGVYVVPVLINDAITLNFVIDSGAGDVSIPADVVLALIRAGTLNDADFIGQRTYLLANGSTNIQKTFRIRSLKVGDKVVENVTASVAPERGVPLLGQSFLSHFKSWSIDNTAHALLLNE